MHKPHRPPRRTTQPSSARPAKKGAAADVKNGSRSRRNRRRRNWNRAVRRVCGILLVVELALLVFANPHLEVTHVRITGLQTLPTQQVFAEARVPAHTNIFWMALRQPFAARLERDPVIDHVTRSISLPRTLVLHVTERQPYAALAVMDAAGVRHYWLLDKKAVPFRVFDSPPAGVPVLNWQGAAPLLALGQPMRDERLHAAYSLVALTARKPGFSVKKITVDQNGNLCLNNVDNVQIELGQVDALPEKLAMARAALGAEDGALARRMASLDLSSPAQPVYTPRPEGDDKDNSTQRDPSFSGADRQGSYGQ